MERKKSNKADLEGKRGIFFQLGLIVVLSTALIAFEWNTTKSEGNTQHHMGEIDVVEEIIINTHREEPKPPAPPPPPVEELLIVKDDIPVVAELNIEPVDVNQNTFIHIFDLPEEKAEPTPFVAVQDKPGFNGEGRDGFRRYIAQNLIYPREASQHGIQGTVHVQFVVDKFGKVVNVEILRGVHPAIDKEAIRVIRSSPKWKPGSQNGLPVDVIFVFPINFRLQ